jgi:class 3 adenylate cyclase
VIAVSVAGYFDLTSSDMESTVNVSSVFARAVEELAAETSIERVRSTPDEYLFTAGLRSPGYAAQDALQFVQKLRELLDELQAETSRTGEYRVGLSTGRVATGVLRGSELAFGIWGPTVRSALSLVAAADPYQVLLDGTVEAELGDEWNFEPVEVVELQDQRVQAFELPRQQDN